MRATLLDRLPATRYRRFLVYVMGPYKAFEPADLASQTDGDEWDPEAGEYARRDVRRLLEDVRDTLRDDPGFNAFLATDVDIDLDEMDAATQSIGFARAANVVVFVAPSVGKNLGVGIETGAVLEAIDEADRERVVFVHEAGVRSAMIDAVSRRWEATVYAYGDREELVTRIRTFAANVMHRELYGDLTERRAEDR